jgi:probable HAF family extracellular repeat protein
MIPRLEGHGTIQTNPCRQHRPEHDVKALKYILPPLCDRFSGKKQVRCPVISFVIAFGTVLLMPCAALAQNSLSNLGGLNGGIFSTAAGVSADGGVVVGRAVDASLGNVPRAFRWTASDGLVAIGLSPLSSAYAGASPEQLYSIATAVSGDGRVIVGFAGTTLVTSDERAFRWTQADGMVDLGDRAAALAVNRDGTVVVGEWDHRAFRWTQAGGMVSIGFLNGGSSAKATGVSADGSVIVGVARDGAAANATRAFRWTEASGMVSLGVLNGGDHSLANGISSNGTTIVGIAKDGTSGGQFRAFRWTADSGIQSLGVLNRGTFSEALAVSSDGKVVVGTSNVGDVTSSFQGFRWTQATGMQTIGDWLRAHSVSVPADIATTAEGTNADGSVVVGLSNGFAYIARVVENGGEGENGGDGGSGLITLQDLSTSLAGNTASPAQAAGLADLVLHGAHSRPLARRVEPQKSCVWISGDFGRDDHQSRDGRFGLAEFGGCHRLASDLQGSISLGRSWSNQGLVFNGKSDVHATYGIAELLGRVAGNLWASGAILYQGGSADVRRGYLNAGVQDFSRGSPDVRTAVLRLRLDWEEAARVEQATLTPYIDATYMWTRIAAYTETSGSFPARFDKRTEHATELRVGVDAAYPLRQNTKLHARVEAAHRFDTTAASISGTVLGLFDFSLPGQGIDRDWLRGGIGFATKLGGGTLSAMLNAATSGPAPSYWLNASFQVAF